VVWKEWEIYYLGEGGRDRKIWGREWGSQSESIRRPPGRGEAGTKIPRSMCLKKNKEPCVCGVNWWRERAEGMRSEKEEVSKLFFKINPSNWLITHVDESAQMIRVWLEEFSYFCNRE
jgi:hypothetical protein